MLALLIGALAGRGFSDFASTKGATQLIFTGVGALLTVLVATSVITVGESLFPSAVKRKSRIAQIISPRQ